MGINLHAAVRGAINAVNPDVLGLWRESSGASVGADYRPGPSYTNHPDVRMQVQALSGKDLQHPAMLSVQGVTRAVYMFGTVQGVSKPQAKGGDLLQFAETDSGPARVWLVVTELEQWNPAGAWCKVAVVLQTDTAIVAVPDVVELAQTDAEEAIEAAGFVVGDVTTANSGTVPEGDVISQSPEGGAYELPGTSIDIVVSLGPVIL